MTLVGLFGVAMHLQYYWAAGALAAIFVTLVIISKRRVKRKD